MLLGILLLAGDYVLTDSSRVISGDMLERLLAERYVATGEIRVSAQDDNRVQIAFRRAQGAQTGESVLAFVSADDYGSKYQVRSTGPNHDQALMQLEALLDRFRSEYGGAFGRDVETFTSPTVRVVQTPELAAKRRKINLSLLLPGLAMLAVGLFLYWTAPKSDRIPLVTRES